MKALIQRVRSASVQVNGQKVSSIHHGILTLLGIAKGDNEATVKKAILKICDLRIFEDANGKMNLSLRDIQGEHLIVSQFTLVADCTQGRRPSFVQAEAPEQARQLYEAALGFSRESGIPTYGGVFQAHMEVSLVNDGPVTLLLEL